MATTRGAVMAIARIGERDATIETISVGNIAVQLAGPQRARRFGGSSAVVGTSQQRPLRLRTETTPLSRGDVFVMMSDGIKTNLALEAEVDLLREHPVVIASEIVRRFGRNNDDALVLVTR
jgi:hypothetical protein